MTTLPLSTILGVTITAADKLDTSLYEVRFEIPETRGCTRALVIVGKGGVALIDPAGDTVFWSGHEGPDDWPPIVADLADEAMRVVRERWGTSCCQALGDIHHPKCKPSAA